MKNLENLGKILDASEQLRINGGACSDAAKISCMADGGLWVSFGDCWGYCICSDGHDDPWL